MINYVDNVITDEKITLIFYKEGFISEDEILKYFHQYIKTNYASEMIEKDIEDPHYIYEGDNIDYMENIIFKINWSDIYGEKGLVHDYLLFTDNYTDYTNQVYKFPNNWFNILNKCSDLIIFKIIINNQDS
jgi:hypothetical protein